MKQFKNHEDSTVEDGYISITDIFPGVSEPPSSNYAPELGQGTFQRHS